MAEKASHRTMVLKLCGFTVGMFAFGFALVPLYDVFCDITGLGGRTNATPAAVVEEADETRTVRVEFVTSLGQYAPWEFHPAVSHMEVHPGKLYQTYFYARNLTGAPLTASTVPSVTPGIAAKHLKKTQCFCFTPQPFEAKEERRMPVVFMLDRNLPAHIDTLTLSYTIYAAAEPVAQR